MDMYRLDRDSGLALLAKLVRCRRFAEGYLPRLDHEKIDAIDLLKREGKLDWIRPALTDEMLAVRQAALRALKANDK